MNRKYTKPLLVVAAFSIISIITLVSYAYFTASVQGNNNANQGIITTGHMEVTFENGSEIGTTENMIPGDYVTKTFSVTNTGDVYALYDIYLTEVINSFVNTDELVYELISEDGTNLSERECPTQETLIAANNGLDVGQTHHYTLKITFLNKDYNQDANKGTTFSTKVNLVQSFQTTRKIASYINFDDINYDLTLSNATLQNFYNTYHKEVYLKQNTVTNTANVTRAYLYENKYLFDTMQECEEYSQRYSEDDYIFDCEIDEHDGAILRFANKKNVYLTEKMCIEESNNMYYDDNCKLFDISQTPIEVIANKKITSTKICVYNGGNEMCVDQIQPYDTENIEGTRPPVAAEQQIIEYINNYANYSCESHHIGTECINKINSNHNAIELRMSKYGEISISYQIELYDLYKYVEAFDSEAECQEYADENYFYECLNKNGQYIVYDSSGDSYDSMQKCEQKAIENGYSNYICQLREGYFDKDVCRSLYGEKPSCFETAR